MSEDRWYFAYGSNMSMSIRECGVMNTASNTGDDGYFEEAKNEVIRWESEKPGFLSKVGDSVLWPAQKAAEALIPEGVQDHISKAIEKFFVGVEWTSRRLVGLEEIRERVGAYHENPLEEFKAADRAAKHYWNWHVAYGAVEGGATGALGLPGLAADIPALFTVCMRLIQQIGTCYGYDVTNEVEREYVLKILQAGSTSDVKAKMEFVIALLRSARPMSRAWAVHNGSSAV